MKHPAIIVRMVDFRCRKPQKRRRVLEWACSKYGEHGTTGVFSHDENSKRCRIAKNPY